MSSLPSKYFEIEEGSRKFNELLFYMNVHVNVHIINTFEENVKDELKNVSAEIIRIPAGPSNPYSADRTVYIKKQ
jgi:hypothetical protein